MRLQSPLRYRHLERQPRPRALAHTQLATAGGVGSWMYSSNRLINPHFVDQPVRHASRYAARHVVHRADLSLRPAAEPEPRARRTIVAPNSARALFGMPALPSGSRPVLGTSASEKYGSLARGAPPAHTGPASERPSVTAALAASGARRLAALHEPQRSILEAAAARRASCGVFAPKAAGVALRSPLWRPTPARTLEWNRTRSAHCRGPATHSRPGPRPATPCARAAADGSRTLSASRQGPTESPRAVPRSLGSRGDTTAGRRATY